MQPWIPALRGACPRARLRRDPGAPAGMTTFECESNVKITTLINPRNQPRGAAAIGRIFRKDAAEHSLLIADADELEGDLRGHDYEGGNRGVADEDAKAADEFRPIKRMAHDGIGSCRHQAPRLGHDAEGAAQLAKNAEGERRAGKSHDARGEILREREIGADREQE